MIPLILFFSVLKLTIFDNFFYEQKFLDYNIHHFVDRANEVHLKVMNFITGKSKELPNVFNEREKLHLSDVRKIILNLHKVFYGLIGIFILIFLIELYLLNEKKKIVDFIGNLLFFGGFLTIIFSSVLFYLVSTNFTITFDSFHKLFFEEYSYIFDPTKDIIVMLYPEQLFMELGIRVMKIIFFVSIIIIGLGAFFVKFKRK